MKYNKYLNSSSKSLLLYFGYDYLNERTEKDGDELCFFFLSTYVMLIKDEPELSYKCTTNTRRVYSYQLEDEAFMYNLPQCRKNILYYLNMEKL